MLKQNREEAPPVPREKADGRRPREPVGRVVPMVTATDLQVARFPTCPEGDRAMASLQWPLSWLVVVAMGLAPIPGLLGGRVTSGATPRKKPIRPANTVFDSREKDKQWAAAQPNAHEQHLAQIYLKPL